MVPGHSKENCKKQWMKTQHMKNVKYTWTEEEDIILSNIVKTIGTKSWTKISAEFNKSFSDRERTRKQCRDRWQNNLNPSINK